jgi:hypothetical protein
MTDQMKELLSAGPEMKGLGASHAENAGLPFLGSGSEAGRAALAKFEAAGMVERSKLEMGGGADGVDQLMQALMGFQGRSARELITLRGMDPELAKRVVDHRASLWDVATHAAPRVFSDPRHPGEFITAVSLYHDPNHIGGMTLQMEDPTHPIQVPGAPLGVTRPAPNEPVNPYDQRLEVLDARGNVIYPCDSLDNRRGTAAYALVFNAFGLRLMTGVEDQQQSRALFSMPEGSSDVDAAAEALFAFATGGASTMASAQEHEEFIQMAKTAFRPQLMIAMRNAAQPISGVVEQGGVLRRVGALIHISDYLDQMIGSQKLAEKMMSKKLVDELRQPYVTGSSKGALYVPIDLIRNIWRDRLGLTFDPAGNPEQKIVSLNYYDPFTGGAVTAETAGESGAFGVALGAEYQRYLISRGLFHLFGLDKIGTDGLKVDLPPGRRKAEFPAWYDGPEYNLSPAGRAESETVAEYNSFVAEKILPKTIDALFNYSGGGVAELRSLRGAIGQELPSVFDQELGGAKRSLKEAQRAVVDRVLTRVTIGPEWSEFMDFPVWALITRDEDSRELALEQYSEWVMDPLNNILDSEKSIEEMQRYLGYMEKENPFSHTNYLRAPDRVGRSFEEWLQRKELEKLYDPQLTMHRPAELRTTEEMKMAVDNLLPFEQAILDGIGSGDALNFGEQMVSIGMITQEELDADPDAYKGYEGMGQFVKKFSLKWLDWRPSVKDINSWLDYQDQRMKIMKNNKDIWRLLQDADQSVGNSQQMFGITVSMMKAVNEAMQKFSDESYNFVPADEKARMATAFVLYVMRQICPLAPESWMLGIAQLRAQKSTQRSFSEMYIPDKMLEENVLSQVLRPLGYRIHGGKITTPNRYPVRVRAKRGNIQSLFSLMSTPKELKKSGMPLTVLGLQFPHLRVPGWREAMEAMLKGAQDTGAIRPSDVDYVRKAAAKLFDSKYTHDVLTRSEKKLNTTENVGDFLSTIADILPKF